MKIYDLKEVYNYEFVVWLLNNLPELNAYQKQKIKDINYNQDSDFYIFKKKEKTSNIFLRLTIILFPIVYLLIVLSLPINFIFSGRWGYKYENLGWFNKWLHKLNL